MVPVRNSLVTDRGAQQGKEQCSKVDAYVDEDAALLFAGIEAGHGKAVRVHQDGCGDQCDHACEYADGGAGGDPFVGLGTQLRDHGVTSAVSFR
jgi:hypothetical protein